MSTTPHPHTILLSIYASGSQPVVRVPCILVPVRYTGGIFHASRDIYVSWSKTKNHIYHTMRGSRRAKSSKNGFSLNESLSSCDKYVFWFLNI